MGRLVDENGYLIDEYDILTGEDLDDASVGELYQSQFKFSWVIEKTMKDGTHAFEFPSNLTEQQARDRADAILGSTPGVDTVSIYRKVGSARRIQSTSWEP